MFFNPCSHLAINDHYILAKVRRSEFKERFWDTFEAINGRIVKDNSKPLHANEAPKESHVGVLDYLLFPVLLPLMWWCKDNPNSNVTMFVMGIKSVISFLLTVGCVPLELIGHWISLGVNAIKDTEVENLEIITDRKKEIVEKIESIIDVQNELVDDKTVSTEKTVKTTKTTKTRIVEEKDYHEKLSQIAHENVTYAVTKGSEGEENKLYLSLPRPAGHSSWFPVSDYTFFNVRIPVTEENKTGIRWMLESNYDHILEKLPAQELKDLIDETDKPVKLKL